MFHWIQHHGFDCLLIYFVFNCIVSPMPAPSDTSSAWYKYLYGVAHQFLNLVAGNLARIPALQPFLLTEKELTIQKEGDPTK